MRFLHNATFVGNTDLGYNCPSCDRNYEEEEREEAEEEEEALENEYQWYMIDCDDLGHYN